MLTAERKAQIDQMLTNYRNQQGGNNSSTSPSATTPAASVTQPNASGGLTPERKAQIDQMLAQYRTNQNTASPQQSVQQQDNSEGFIPTIAKPFTKLASSALGFVQGVGDLGSAGINYITGNKQAAMSDVQNAANDVTKERDYGIFGKARPYLIDQKTGKALSTGEGIKDLVGGGLEVGSYFLPGGAEAKPLIEGVEALAKPTVRDLAANGAKTLLKSGVKNAAIGTIGSVGSELQNPSSDLASTVGAGIKGFGTGFGVGAAAPIIGGLANKGVSVAGRLGSEILGRTTGSGEAAISEAFRNPNVAKYIHTGTAPEELMTQALEEAKNGLKSLKNTRSTEYVGKLDQIKASKKEMDAITEATRNTAKDLLEQHRIKLQEGKLLNNLNFEDSTIERGQGTVQKAFNDVMRWTDNTPGGLDKLQKNLSQHLDEIPATERGGAFHFVLDLKNSVSEALKNNVPGYRDMTSGYHQASDLIDEITSALSLRDKTAQDTAVRKLMSTMRQNNELRKDMLATLGKAGSSDITGKIAAAALKPLTPRGLAGYVGSAAGAASIISPAHLPALLVYLSTTSPRFVAEVVNILGRFKGSTLPAIAKKQIQNVVTRAINSQPESSQSTIPDQRIAP